MRRIQRLTVDNCLAQYHPVEEDSRSIEGLAVALLVVLRGSDQLDPDLLLFLGHVLALAFAR